MIRMLVNHGSLKKDNFYRIMDEGGDWFRTTGGVFVLKVYCELNI
jgi:hypothetical protein